jgi:biopolymer transport protein ExbD
MTNYSDDTAEPNLTPLLDVVLQLVMFFMLCANFVMDQVNESVKLPEAIAAKAVDREADNFIILNVNAQGHVLIGNTDPLILDSPGKIRSYLQQQLAFDRGRAKPADWAANKGRSVVILRADQRCRYRMVHDILESCRQVGYTNLQLRVTQVAGAES